MEQNNLNRFELLAEMSTPPSPTLPPTATEAAAAGNLTESPLPTNLVESLNNSTLIPTQTPEGMERVIVEPSPTLIQLITEGATTLAVLECGDRDPRRGINALDYADDPSFLSMMECMIPPPSDNSPSPDTVLAREAKFFCDAWVAEIGRIAPATIEALQVEYLANVVGDPNVWELACWMHWLQLQLPSPGPNTQEAMHQAVPLPVVMAPPGTALNPLVLSESDPMLETEMSTPHLTAAMERAKHHSTRSQSMTRPLQSRRPSLSTRRITAIPLPRQRPWPHAIPREHWPSEWGSHTPSDHSSVGAAIGEHPRHPITVDTPSDPMALTRSPPEDMGHPDPTGHMSSHVPRPLSPMEVVWGGSTQTQEARAKLDELHAMSSVWIPTQAKSQHLYTHPEEWTLSAGNWFCGMSVLLAAITREPLSDTFTLHADLEHPETQLELVRSMTEQLLSELTATGENRLNREDLWNSIKEQEILMLHDALRKDAERDIGEWEHEMIASLKGKAINRALAGLIEDLEAEGSSCAEGAELAKK
ncbi:hypothetical protein EDB83DRAFT_2315975 [Lactarius deliciosus]|nr:hypothetical protein EDB83DRAFT_2315975 [Lactarius deliciosus]